MRKEKFYQLVRSGVITFFLLSFCETNFLLAQNIFFAPTAKSVRIEKSHPKLESILVQLVELYSAKGSEEANNFAREKAINLKEDKVKVIIVTKKDAFLSQSRLSRRGVETEGRYQKIDSFKPWKASLALTYHILSNRGFDFQNGIDQKLRECSLADSRTISYLEHPLRSLQCFDSLSTDYSLKLLEEVVNNPIKVIEFITKLITAWKQQDLSTIDNILNSLLSEHFDLFSDLLLRRNEEWLQKLINETLPDETPKLIVVGILHCVGERGITSLMLDHNIQTTTLKNV